MKPGVGLLNDDLLLAENVQERPAITAHDNAPVLQNEWQTFPEELVTLSEGGTVATQTVHEEDTLLTSGSELAQGRHYFEVELLSDEMADIYIGVSRPNLDPRVDHSGKDGTDGWFISARYGAPCGNGKGCAKSERKGTYEHGDHVGVLLDLDEGSLCFFKNGIVLATEQAV